MQPETTGKKACHLNKSVHQNNEQNQIQLHGNC